MLVLHISPVFPQDPNLSEWVSAWFIGGGNNGGGGWVLWFDSTPLAWIFLCALGPSSFWRWCDFWWQATKHRLQVDISRMATCVSGLTNDWLGGTGMAYSRFLAQKGRGWEGGRRRGRWTITPNRVISLVVISHGGHNRSWTKARSLGEMHLFSIGPPLLNSPGSCGVKLLILCLTSDDHDERKDINA